MAFLSDLESDVAPGYKRALKIRKAAFAQFDEEDRRQSDELSRTGGRTRATRTADELERADLTRKRAELSSVVAWYRSALKAFDSQNGIKYKKNSDTNELDDVGTLRSQLEELLPLSQRRGPDGVTRTPESTAAREQYLALKGQYDALRQKRQRIADELDRAQKAHAMLDGQLAPAVPASFNSLDETPAPTRVDVPIANVPAPLTMPEGDDWLSTRIREVNRQRAERGEPMIDAAQFGVKGQQPNPSPRAEEQPAALDRPAAQPTPALAEPATAGFVRGTVNSAKRGLLSAGNSVDAVRLIASENVASDADKMAQQFTANDPKPDPAHFNLSKPSGQRGYDVALQKWELRQKENAERAQSNREFADRVRTSDIPGLAENIVQRQEKIAALPQTEGKTEFDKANGFVESISAVARHPLDTIAGVSAESLPASSPSLVLGAGGSVFGVGGTAVGAGLGSLGSEASSRLLNGLEREGANFKDPNSVRAVLADPEKMDRIRSNAIRGGIPVALFDALSAGVAGRIIRQPAKAMIGKAGQAAAEMGVQGLLGGAGSAAGSVAAGEKIDWKDVLSEVIGEVGSGTQEVITGSVRDRAFGESGRARENQDTRPSENSGESGGNGPTAPVPTPAPVTQEEDILPTLDPEALAGVNISDEQASPARNSGSTRAAVPEIQSQPEATDPIAEDNLQPPASSEGNRREAVGASIQDDAAAAIPSQKQPGENWRITVQRPMGNAPGYVQVDKVGADGKSQGSFSAEQIKAEGYALPDLSNVETGRYSVSDLTAAQPATEQVPSPAATASTPTPQAQQQPPAMVEAPQPVEAKPSAQSAETNAQSASEAVTADPSQAPKAQITTREDAQALPSIPTDRLSPTIPRGENTPDAFIKAVTKHAGIKGSDKAGRFLIDFAPRLHRANRQAFEQMEVHVLSQKQWAENPETSSRAPDKSAAYNPDTNTLYINRSKTKGESLIPAIVHEAGHFTEQFALGEDFTQREWEKLTHDQRTAALKEYLGREVTLAPESLVKNRRARAEWAAMQFTRVVRGDTDGMGAQLVSKLKNYLTVVRALVRKWIGSKELTTPELDAKIIEVMGFSAPGKRIGTAVPAPEGNPSSDAAPSLRQGSGRQTDTTARPKSKRIGMPADGETDILNMLQDMGGLKHPDLVQNKKGGEYDGWNGAMRDGLARQLVRRDGGGSTPDQILGEFENTEFAAIKSPDQLFDAVGKAMSDRKKKLVDRKRSKYVEKWENAFLGGNGALDRGGAIITVDDLSVGDTFKVNGEVFHVLDVDENGFVTVKDGVKQTLAPSTPVFPDNGKVKHAKKSTEFIQEDKAKSQPDLFPPEQTPFNLASEEQKDGGKQLEDQIATNDAQRKLDAAQLPIPGTEKKAPKFSDDLKKQAREAFGDLLGAPSETAYEEGVPSDRAEKFVPLARKMVESGVNTPKSVAEFLEETFGGRARKFSQSLWNFLSFVDPKLTGRQSWADVYTAIDNQNQSDTVQPTEALNEPSPARNLERDRSGADAPNAGREAGVRNEPGSGGLNDRGVAGAGVPGREGGVRADNGGAAVAGEGSDSALPERGPGTGEFEASASSGEQRGGGGDTGAGGILNVSGADTAVVGGAPERPRVDDVAESREVSFEERLKQQRAADRVEVKPADLANIRETLPVLLGDQHIDVLKAERRFAEKPSDSDPRRGVMFTNGTGTGKTFSGLGIVKRAVRQGAKDVLIVVPTYKKAVDWRKDATFVGLDASVLENTSVAGKGLTVTTYANFRTNEKLRDRDFDLVVYDESHKIVQNEEGGSTSALSVHRWITNHPDIQADKATERIIGPRPIYPGSKASADDLSAYRAAEAKWLDLRTENAEKIDAERKRLDGLNKVVFLSATPFAYHKTLNYADGYLFNSPPRSDRTGYNVPQGFDSFLVENFGYRMRYNKLTQPESGVDVNLMERAFADRLMKSGAVSGRMIDVPFDYSREFVAVDPGLGAGLDRGIKVMSGWEDRDANHFNHLPSIASERFKYHYVQQLMEAIKVAQSLDRIREHIALGRKVILFHSYVNATPEHPFRGLKTLAQSESASQEVSAFEAKYPELLKLDFGPLANPLELLAREFGDQVVFFNGNVPNAKKLRAVDSFNDDNSPVRLLVAQADSMSEGVSAHDTTGKHQRVVMNVGLPVKPTLAIQEEGRAYRVGVKSNAINEYIVLHTDTERYAFGSKINERVRTAENLAMGSMARALQDSFKDGYLNPTSASPGDHQGLGGKETDRAQAAVSEFNRAKSLYFGRQKKTAKSKSSEGIDYFATPEPIGLKMVEWLNARPNERLLEPSAGHGAIARFFPAFTTNTYVEPSAALANELRIKVESGETHVQPFEDLHVVNKYDGIVMNPPFGVGGSTAMKHLAKAVDHLRDGGRLIAIIPEGPAADERFEKFIEKAPSALVKVGEVGLPRVAFERAGTSVKTRIVVFDKISDPTARGQVESKPRIDLDAESIGDLFNAIENLSMPARRDVAPPAVDIAAPSAAQTKAQNPGEPRSYFRPEEFPHTRSGETVHVAKNTSRLSGSDYLSVKRIAQKHGGYWSSFKGGRAIPGFHFKTAEKRNAFIDEVNGMTLGAPADTNLEDFAESGPMPEPKKDKPEPVSGQPGNFFRSTPDSLRDNGLDVARQIYTRRGHKQASEIAGEIVDSIGEEAASGIAMSRDENGVPGDVKTVLYGELLSRKAKRIANQETTPEQRTRARREIQRLQSVIPAQFTDFGQRISALQQVYRDVRAATMDGYLKAIQEEQDRKLGPAGKKAIDDATDAVSKADKLGIEEATKELERALRTLPVKKPIWQRYRDDAASRLLAFLESRNGGESQRPPLAAFTDRIISEMRGRIAEQFPTAARAQQPTPAEILREAIANKEKYAEVFKTVRDAFVKEYGATSAAVDLIDTELANIGTVPYSKRTLDRAVKEAHRAMLTSVRDLAKQHITRTDANAAALAEAITLETGIQGEEASKLAADISKRAKQLVADGRKKALQQLRKQMSATPKTHAVLTALERALQLNNLGALNESDLREIVAKKLGLPVLDDAQTKELAEIAERIETAPNSAARARAELELVQKMRILRGFSKADIATGIWYANLLSGYTTQIANTLGNVVNGVLQLASVAATNPTHGADAFAGWISGFSEGGKDAWSILKTGRGLRDFDAKTGVSASTIELVDYTRDFTKLNRRVAQALNLQAGALRYVFRAMKAVDAVFYYPAKEAYTRVVVAKLLAAQYSGKELRSKVRQTLQIAPDAYLNAVKQAEREGFTGIDQALRVSAIVDDRRKATVEGKQAVEMAEQFALETTYNNEPVGWAGVLYHHLEQLTGAIRPFGVPVLKAFLPFLRIPTNLFNTSMNYTPVGAVRAFRGVAEVKQVGPKAEITRKEFTRDERARLLVQSIGGSLAMAAIFAMAGGDPGDDEPWFTITANGPTDYRKQQQLRQTGWRDHAMKFGDVWVSYKDSPLLVPLAVIGNLVDARRYQKSKDDFVLNKAFDVAMRSTRTVFDTSMLSGLGNLMDFIRDNASANQVSGFLQRIPTDMAIPFSNLLRQVDRSFNPQVREPSALSGIPFARNAAPERTDVLGQPILSPAMGRFGGTETNDPLREVLRQKNVFISTPGKDTKVGSRPMTPEEYREYVAISGAAIYRRLSIEVPRLEMLSPEKVEKEVERITREERDRAKARISIAARRAMTTVFDN